MGLIQLLKEYESYKDIFCPLEAEVLLPHRHYDCVIDLVPGEKVPIYSLSATEEKALQECIQDFLRKGFIRPSKSPAGAPIFLVEKKLGKLRPCVDYQTLNAITVKNRYPLPLISDLIDQVKAATCFTKMDLRGAYYLVRIKGDEWKTAFNAKFSHLEYLVMPFDLRNAPVAFQFFITDIFRDIIGVFLVV